MADDRSRRDAGLAGKFDELETLPLFDLPSVETSTAQQGDVRKATPARSVNWAICANCAAVSVGLLRVGSHLVWRNHDRVSWAGVRTPCRASSVRLCDAPAKQPPQGRPPRCPCGRAPLPGAGC